MATFEELLAQIQASAQKAKSGAGMSEAEVLASASPMVREMWENPEKLMQGLMPFGMPSRTGNGMLDMMYGLGLPIYSADYGMTNIYKDNYNANLDRGVPPTTGFPANWGGTGASAGGGSKPGSGSTGTGGLPAWWVDWYNKEGKFGGANPMPVQGLL